MPFSVVTVLGSLLLKARSLVRLLPSPRLLASLAGALLGATWYLLRFGWRSLSFTNIDWLMSGDWSQHAIGFLHYRLARWGFPLGRIDTIVAPVGTNVGFTDSNPLLCLLLKPFSGILPVDFQFIGLWLFLCFVLQGLAGVWIGRLITRSQLGAVLASAFFITSPALDARVCHPTLSAHFLILFALLLNIVPDDSSMGRRRFALGAVLVCLAAAIHPTMCVMVLALVLASIAQQLVRGALPKLGAAWRAGALIAAVFIIWRAIGLIGGDELREAGGLGYYNADLTTFFHPSTMSRIIPRLPLDSGAYEGFAYLGLGALGMGLLMPGLLAANARETWARLRKHLFLVSMCLVMMLLAFSVRWRVFGQDVLNLERAAKPLSFMLEPFRSSGRFIWPMHYLLIVAVLFAWWRFLPLPRWTAMVLCLLLVVVQVMDTKRDIINTNRSRADWYHLNMPLLERLAQGRTKLELHPAMMWSNGPGCGTQEWDMGMISEALYTAYRLHLPANTGHLARSSRRHEQSCRKQISRVMNGEVSRNTLYLVHAKRLGDLARLPGVVCRASGSDSFACVLN